MFLAVDLGNTSVVFAFFEGNDIVCDYRMKTDSKMTPDDYCVKLSLYLESKHINPELIRDILVSSVVPSLNEAIVFVCETLFHIKPLFIGPGVPSGIRVNTDNPKEVGGDLIADCAGAKALFNEPCLIVDLGTATKLIVMGKDGAFEGCCIAPGVAISLSALVGNAALLGDVDIKIPSKTLGKNTGDSISSALTYGTAYSIKGLADALEKEVGYPLKRVLTGGYARILGPLLPDYHYEPNLTLIGIKAIFERNHR